MIYYANYVVVGLLLAIYQKYRIRSGKAKIIKSKVTRLDDFGDGTTMIIVEVEPPSRIVKGFLPSELVFLAFTFWGFVVLFSIASYLINALVKWVIKKFDE